MILAIDSSQSSGSIALKSEGRLVYSLHFDIKITHSETLMPAIDHALAFCGADKRDLKAVYVCNGPGSFTGLRIGLATAKGIAFGLQIPLFAFSSLLLCAQPAAGLDKNILACIDAKMKELYFALYDHNLQELIPPRVSTPAALAEMRFSDFILCGSGADIVEPLLKENKVAYNKVNSTMQIPSAAGLFALGLRLPDLNKAQNLAELEPLYLRESTAQVRAKNK